MSRNRIAILNGSLGGADGNTGAVLGRFANFIRPHAELSLLHLDARPQLDDALVAELKLSRGFVFATGTYWDSWGSPLQRFLENVTAFEGGPLWMGKPAAVLVTMHAVGGKGVLSRLQGVLSSLGLLIPPMTGMVYSLANHLALQGKSSTFLDDLWQLKDLEVVAHNLLQSFDCTQADWRGWPVDGEDPRRRWM